MGATPERSELVLDLFEEYYERVYCFVRKAVPGDQAEDITQDVFIRLLERGNLERMSITVSYLLKIAHNLVKRRYRRSQQFARFVNETGAQRHEDPCEATTSPRGIALEASALESAMECLTCDEREAMRLIVAEGLSYEHAARSLGVPTSTINNWKHRGLHKLQHNERFNDPY